MKLTSNAARTNPCANRRPGEDEVTRLWPRAEGTPSPGIVDRTAEIEEPFDPWEAQILHDEIPDPNSAMPERTTVDPFPGPRVELDEEIEDLFRGIAPWERTPEKPPEPPAPARRFASTIQRTPAPAVAPAAPPPLPEAPTELGENTLERAFFADPDFQEAPEPDERRADGSPLFAASPMFAEGTAESPAAPCANDALEVLAAVSRSATMSPPAPAHPPDNFALAPLPPAPTDPYPPYPPYPPAPAPPLEPAPALPLAPPLEPAPALPLAPPPPLALAPPPEPAPDPAPAPGLLAALFNCRGGAGATTVAVNLAASLARDGKQVCLVDLDLQLGDVLTTLDLGDAREASVATIARDAAVLDGSVLKRRLSRHASGAYVLSQVGRLEEIDGSLSDHLSALFALLTRHFDLVLVDGIHDFGEFALPTLDAADLVMLVATQDVASVRRAGRVLEICHKLEYPHSKLRLVLNRFHRGASIRPPEIERALGLPVHATVANDYKLSVKAMDAGRPLVELSRRRRVARDLRSLAGWLLDEQARLFPEAAS
jgi:MinD-like ATPase involved in chromosome partitioning or flagellar assembly